MTEKFTALLTHVGAAKLANATALGTRLEITQMAVGDGGGTLPTPNPAQTRLINEKRRAALNTLRVDPINTSQLIAEQVIPAKEGGWWIREIGLFDKEGDLIAIANCPESYKPLIQQGSGRTQTICVILVVSSTAAVTLKIDPSVVLATRKSVDDKVIEVKAYVDRQLTAHEQSRNHPDATLAAKGFVKLSSATDSSSETDAATPKAINTAAAAAVKALADHAKSRNHPDATLTAKGFVKLSSATDSSSETDAATPKAINTAATAAAKALAEHAKSRNHPDATLAAKGFVKLSSATDSNSETDAATPKAVNTVAAAAAKALAEHAKSRNHPDATLAAKGVVKLSSATDSSSETDAATPKAVKAVNDNASSRVSKGGDTIAGQLKIRGTDALRICDAEYGIIFRRSETSLHLIPTARGHGENGQIGALRPLSIALSTGRVSMANSLGVSGGATITGGLTVTGAIIATGEVQAGGGQTRMAGDGNIYGAKWGNQWLDTYLRNTYQPKGSYTPAGQAYTTAESNARFQAKNAASKAENGWFKDISTGMIIQWGRLTNSAVGYFSVTFPIAFPSACASVSNTVDRTGRVAGANDWSSVRSVSRTGFQAGTDLNGAFWMAIGF